MAEIVDGSSYRINLGYRGGERRGENTARNRQNLVSAIDQLVAGNKDPFWALFSQDVTFHEAECLPYGGSFHGVEETIRAHAKIYDYFDQIHIELEQILAEGDLAIAYARMTYRVRKNGRTGAFTLAELYRFRGGKVIEWRVHYFDASKVAEALAAD